MRSEIQKELSRFYPCKNVTEGFAIRKWPDPWSNQFVPFPTTALSRLLDMSSPMSAGSMVVPQEATPLAPRPSHTSPLNVLPLSSVAPNESVMSVIQNSAFSKTWVLPPRKKPGRKAASDVPPTVSFLQLHSYRYVTKMCLETTSAE